MLYREMEEMDRSYRANLVAKVTKGEMTLDQAKAEAARDGWLALMCVPLAVCFAIFSPILLTLVFSNALTLLSTVVGVSGLIYFSILRKAPEPPTIECSRCLNMDPANLKGGKFSCTVCGHTI